MRRMRKNNKGQIMFVGIMICIMAIITTIMLIEPMKEFLNIAVDTDHLDCSNTSISTGEKAACVITDWILPYFVGVCFAVAISWVGFKKIKEGKEGSA